MLCNFKKDSKNQKINLNSTKALIHKMVYKLCLTAPIVTAQVKVEEDVKVENE